eukprot:Skav214340  [mRNA]  locus=scaffold86:376006:380987:+ [translate_table: standard]
MYAQPISNERDIAEQPLADDMKHPMKVGALDLAIPVGWKARPPGVAVRSALRDAVRRPRMVFALLHRRVRTLGLGEECTVIVHGDGKKPDEHLAEVQNLQFPNNFQICV